jgi:hypothetical protein
MQNGFFRFRVVLHYVTRMKRTHQLCTKSDKSQGILLKYFAPLLEEMHFNNGVRQSFPGRC